MAGVHYMLNCDLSEITDITNDELMGVATAPARFGPGSRWLRRWGSAKGKVLSYQAI